MILHILHVWWLHYAIYCTYYHKKNTFCCFTNQWIGNVPNFMKILDWDSAKFRQNRHISGLGNHQNFRIQKWPNPEPIYQCMHCLLYTSDAADE